VWSAIGAMKDRKGYCMGRGLKVVDGKLNEMKAQRSGGRKARTVRIFVIALVSLIIINTLPLKPVISASGESFNLAKEGKGALSLLIFASILWITEVMPFAVTSLIIILLLPFLRITDIGTAVKDGFGNPLIVFFISVFILSGAISESGLGDRLVRLFVKRSKGRPKAILLSILSIGAFLTMWMTGVAGAAILTPIGRSLLKNAGLKEKESDFGRAVMIACAWGPLVGGVAAPTGTGVNLYVINILKELTGVNISFINWLMLGIPASLMMIPCAWFVLLKFFPPEVEEISVGEIEGVSEEMPLSRKEISVLVIFSMTIFLWIAGPYIGSYIGLPLTMESVALMGAVSLFLPGIEVLTWSQAEKRVDWGGLLLIATGLSLGMALFKTGAAKWIGWLLFGWVTNVDLILRVFLIAFIVCLMKLVFSSNTVTGVVIIPVIIAVAQESGINPWLLVAPAAFTESLAFILVTSSPTNVIPYSTGYFSIKDMIKAGAVMTIFAVICVSISIIVVGHFTGIYIL
jgi:sodium-dependent dicarboxylate transporter 2/3/5